MGGGLCYFGRLNRGVISNYRELYGGGGLSETLNF